MGNFNSSTRCQRRPEKPWDGPTQDQLKSSISENLACLRMDLLHPDVLNLSKEVEKRLMRFTDSFYSKLSAIHPTSLEDFAKACKSRSDELTTLLAKLSTVSEDFELFVVRSNTCYEIPGMKYISGKTKVTGINDDDDVIDVFLFEKSPKWYRHLFLGVLCCAELAHSFPVEDKRSRKDCIRLANEIISISRLFLNIRSNVDMILNQEEASLARMTNPDIVQMQPWFLDLRNQVINDINEDRLRYIRRYKAALDASYDFRMSTFSDEDYSYSTKAACSAPIDKKMRKAMTVLHSCFEHDPFLDHAVQKCIGYTSHYNKIPPKRYIFDTLKTCSIDQSKYKRRIIKMAMNAIQDICNYIHRRANAFLQELETDCTVDQDKMVRFGLKVTGRKYREERNYPGVYCTDISDATGTINQQFELMNMKLLFPEEVCEFWKDVLALPQTFQFFDGSKKTYKQTVGQPQGLGGSFELFANDHHILMLMVMKINRLEDKDSADFYRLLGDDDIIFTIVPDPELVIWNSIIAIYEQVNWKLELGKCIINTDKDKIAIAEVAKVTVVDGDFSSPPPIRLVGRFDHPTTPAYAITALLWKQTHGYITHGALEKTLDRWFNYSILDRKIADTFVRGGLSKHFDCYKHASLRTDDEFRMQVALCYLVAKIRGTFLESLLSKDIRNNGGIEEDKPILDILKATFGKQDSKFWTGLIEDPDHKVHIMIRKNTAIRDALEILLEDPEVTWVCLGLGLNQREKAVINGTTELLQTVRETGQLHETSFDSIRRLLDDIESFNRFQMRSISKAGAMETSYLTEMIRLYKELFPIKEEIA